MPIHPTAVIDDNADIDAAADIGPYAVVHGNVRIGARTRVGPHAVIHPFTSIGTDNEVHSGTVLGDIPQSIGWDRDTPSRLEIGDGNTFREGCTMHRGQEANGVTRIGNNNYFMVGAHVGHDGHVADHVIFANGATIGGHAQVQSGANLSAYTLVHQFCRVGRLAMMQGSAAISLDLPPFMMASGRNSLAGLNTIGLQRAGISKESRKALRHAYKSYFLSEASADDALATAEADHGDDPIVQELIAFIRGTQKGVVRRQRTRRRDGQSSGAQDGH